MTHVNFDRRQRRYRELSTTSATHAAHLNDISRRVINRSWNLNQIKANGSTKAAVRVHSTSDGRLSSKYKFQEDAYREIQQRVLAKEINAREVQHPSKCSKRQIRTTTNSAYSSGFCRQPPARDVYFTYMRTLLCLHTSRIGRVSINSETEILSNSKEEGSDGGDDVLSTSDLDATPTNNDVKNADWLKNGRPRKNQTASLQ